MYLKSKRLKFSNAHLGLLFSFGTLFANACAKRNFNNNANAKQADTNSEVIEYKVFKNTRYVGLGHGADSALKKVFGAVDFMTSDQSKRGCVLALIPQRGSETQKDLYIVGRCSEMPALDSVVKLSDIKKQLVLANELVKERPQGSMEPVEYAVKIKVEDTSKFAFIGTQYISSTNVIESICSGRYQDVCSLELNGDALKVKFNKILETPILPVPKNPTSVSIPMPVPKSTKKVVKNNWECCVEGIYFASQDLIPKSSGFICRQANSEIEAQSLASVDCTIWQQSLSRAECRNQQCTVGTEQSE